MKEIFQAHYGLVCQTTYRFVRDKSQAEDLAQEVFFKFWEKRQQIHIQSSLPAYLKMMATNEALQWLRKQRHYEDESGLETISENTPDGMEQLKAKELSTTLSKAIDQLPPKCRAIFQMSRQEGLTYKQIAEKLDISIKTVENQMSKALKDLKYYLRDFLTIFF